MDKKKLEIIITIGLGLILVIAWVNTFKFMKVKMPKKSTAVIAIVSPVMPSLPQAEKPKEAESKSEGQADAWSRDPFSGKIYFSQEGGSGLSLTGIIWDKKKPQALINDEVCAKGDKVGKYTVITIEKNGVILSDGVAQTELKIE